MNFVSFIFLRGLWRVGRGACVCNGCMWSLDVCGELLVGWFKYVCLAVRCVLQGV